MTQKTPDSSAPDVAQAADSVRSRDTRGPVDADQPAADMLGRPTPSVPQQDAVFFLQAFVAQIVEASKQVAHTSCTPENYIDIIGRATSSCLEDASRKQLGLTREIDPDQYSQLIINLKNRIGGNFSRASSEANQIRVINTRCPFGDAVRYAPELCRMTSSVFGGIAARNFGYAKVDLQKRIAVNDGMCEVCIYTDPETARGRPGDEYFGDRERISADSDTEPLLRRLEKKIHETWCAGHPGKAPAAGRPSLVAESRAMRTALKTVELVAATPTAVLITGETGVGKEVIARALHALSDKAERELVSVNCGTIPESLIESVLFGHEKGAFTSAYNVHHGLFERADKGTLFLDEIDCIPVASQARLLRVLQEGEYERVGGNQTLKADTRIIAAANRNLMELVESGNFRRDLFYRLNVVPIHIPPLRERKDDILPLCERYLSTLAGKYNRSEKILGDRARFKALMYEWPGNVRELQNILERAFLFTAGTVIEDIDVKPVLAVSNDKPSPSMLKELKKNAALRAELDLIREVMTLHHGDINAAARMMGVTPRAVHMKLKAHGMSARDFRNNDSH